jgi:hypothetical protein
MSLLCKLPCMITRILCVFCSLWLLPLQATITPIDTLEPFEQALVNLNTEDLVLFDVDNVLLVPDDALFRPVGEVFLKKFIASMGGLYENFSFEERWGRILEAMTVSLVDERMPFVVRALQERGIPTLAFTACWTGPLGPVSNCADWRIEQLRKLGFSFESMFPHLVGWQVLEGAHPVHRPTFKSGVLFSPRRPKGQTLKEFLEAVAWTPRSIVMLDDREDFLKTVEIALQELGIEFRGFQYLAVHHLPCTFDERIAAIQLNHLMEHDEWLSDSVLINNRECATIR